MKWVWAPAALAAGALALALVVLDRDDPGPDRPSAPAPAVVDVDPLLFPRKGLRLDRPDAWTAKRRRGVVRLRSGDGRIAVSLATRPWALSARGARQAAEETVGRAYPRVRVVRRRRATLGGRPARAVELVARGRGGALVDLLVMGGRSRWRSYAVTVVSLRPVADDALRQLGTVLDSIEFLKPAD